MNHFLIRYKPSKGLFRNLFLKWYSQLRSNQRAAHNNNAFQIFLEKEQPANARLQLIQQDDFSHYACCVKLTRIFHSQPT